VIIILSQIIVIISLTIMQQQHNENVTAWLH